MKNLMLNMEELRDINTTIQNIAQVAQKRFSADLSIVWAVNLIDKSFLNPPAVACDLRKAAVTDSRNLQLDNAVHEIAQKAIDQGFLYVDHLAEKPEYINLFGLKNIQSLVVLSLRTRRRQKPLAVLFLCFDRFQQLDSDDIDDVKSFADEYSSILQSTWLIKRYRDVIRVGHEINQELETHETLFNRIQASMGKILDTSYFFMLAVYQQQTNSLDLYMSDRDSYKFEKSSLLEGACAYVMKKKQSLIRNHLSTEYVETSPQFIHIHNTEKVLPESVIFVPLILRDTPLGVLSIQQLHPNSYGDDDLQIMELLGNQVVLALSNLRLFEYLESLNKTGQQLTKQISSGQLLQGITDQIKDITKADVVILYPFLHTERRFEDTHKSGDLLEPDFHRPPNVRREDIAWRVMTKGEPVFAKDSSTVYRDLGGDPHDRKGNFEEREQIHSTAAVPLRLGDETVGILFVNFRQSQRFDAPQKSLILNLASYAAIAIKKSRDMEAMAERQVKELKLLQSIVKEISKSLKLEEVLQTILVMVADRIQSDEASILLYDSQAQALIVKAAMGRNATSYMNLKLPINGGKGITVSVYKNGGPKRVDNVRSDLRWRQIYYPMTSDIISEMDIPLIDGPQVVGVLNFESTKEAAFSQSDEHFMTTLAGQAVLAIKNAQIYEREQQAREALSAMRDVELEIVSQLQVQEVLNTILEKALNLTGSFAGEIMLYDPLQENFYVAAERGIWPEKEEPVSPRIQV